MPPNKMPQYFGKDLEVMSFCKKLSQMDPRRIPSIHREIRRRSWSRSGKFLDPNLGNGPPK